jgi:hypothetical protein
MAANKLKSLKKKTTGAKQAKSVAQSRPVVPQINLPDVRLLAGGAPRIQGPLPAGSAEDNLGYYIPRPPLENPPPLVGPRAPFNLTGREESRDYIDQSIPFSPRGPTPDLTIQQIVDAISQWPEGRNDFMPWWDEEVPHITKWLGIPPFFRPRRVTESPFAGDPDYEAWAAEEERRRILSNSL